MERNARDNALAFEAVKVSMSQTKDGIKITLVIHPNDIPPGLFSDPVGQRYQVAMVGLTDEEAPVERDHSTMDAAILCKQPGFQKWVSRVSFYPADENGAAAYVRDTCNVQSRAHINKSETGKAAFQEIIRKYMESKT